MGILGVLVLGGANLAFCGTVTVFGTDTVFTTIQAKIDTCDFGDTILIATKDLKNN